MGTIDKNTKSLEILGEVPLRMIETKVSKTESEGMLPPSLLTRGSEIRGAIIKESEAPPTITAHSKETPLQNSIFQHSRMPFGLGGALPVATTGTMTTPYSAATVNVSVPPPATVSHTLSETSAVAALTELASHGRTSQEVMSARMLLSLHGPGSSQALDTTMVASSPSRTTKKNPRKQKPVASAKASLPPNSTTNESLKDSSVGTNVKQFVNEFNSSTGAVGNKSNKKKDYTPQELLKILEIPSSGSSSASEGVSHTMKAIAKNNSSSNYTGSLGIKQQNETNVKNLQQEPSNVGSDSSETSSDDEDDDSEDSESDEGSTKQTQGGTSSMTAAVSSSKNVNKKELSHSSSNDSTSSSDTSSDDEEEEEITSTSRKSTTAAMSKRGRGNGRGRGRGGMQPSRPAAQKTRGVVRSVRGRVQKPQATTTKGQRY